MTNSRESIKKLGGASAVARKYGYKVPTVGAWVERGVPAHVLVDDAKLARALKRAGYRRGSE